MKELCNGFYMSIGLVERLYSCIDKYVFEKSEGNHSRSTRIVLFDNSIRPVRELSFEKYSIREVSNGILNNLSLMILISNFYTKIRNSE